MSDTVARGERAERERGLEEDRELLDGFRRGDRAALSCVFRRYARDVARSLQRGVRVEVRGVRQRVGGDLDVWELENLVQETFVKAFSPAARTSYDGVRPFGAWLAVIARNVLIDHARKSRRERDHLVFVEDIAESGSTEEEESPAGRTATRQLASALQRFLAGLSDEDRRLFSKRYEEQRSLRQAATELEMGLFELRKRDARLRVALLEALDSEGLLCADDVHIGTSVLDRRAVTREKERA